MNNEEFLQILSNLTKKLDKTLKLVTTIAKTLHIVPVSEKEEREIQLLQRKNAATMQKIQDELAALEPSKENDEDDSLNLLKIYDETPEEVYSDIIGGDFMVKEE